MNAIEVKNLNKAYQGFRLQDVSFSLPEGSVLGLVGENGAGKSTTIKLIMNSVKRDGGEVTVLGADNQSPAFSHVKEEIGVVLDEAYFPEALTAKNVGAVMRHTYKNWNEEEYKSLLKRFSLPEDKAFKDFSRGMKMKLAIAAALSHSPRLLVLDEATSGLDPLAREEMLELFGEFVRGGAGSILLSSHIVSDLEKVCDYIAFIHQGKFLLCQEKKALLEKYVLLKTSKEGLASLPEGAVRGIKRTEEGAEVLAERALLPGEAQGEKAGLEEIFLFLAKGEK